MADVAVQQAFAVAVQHFNAGRLAEAESVCRQIIGWQSDHADALHLLGVISRRGEDSAGAIDLIGRAIVINPGCENANFNLGNALRDQGHLDEAIAAYRRSILLEQNVSQSYHNLGLTLKEKGQPEDFYWYHQGNLLGEQGRFTEAAAAYRRAILVRPDFAEAHCNLGNALVEDKQFDAGIAAYQRAIQIDPNLPQAHHNLGKVFYDQGKLDKAMSANRQAIALWPDYAGASRNLANNLFEAGRLNEALAIYRQMIGGNDPSNSKIHSDLIYTLHFHPGSDADSIADETRRWNQLYAKPLAGLIQPHANDRTPNRRLRIGYVSPDFRQHVVGTNLVPLFRQHNHHAFEIFCYSGTSRPDALTNWFQQHADQWRNICGLSDHQLAEQIRTDRIDILVDLALHTQENRLLTFARKPAPVQVSFAGYPGSTGLSAIGFRLSDPFLDPPGDDEQIVRLPHTFWCYDPGDCEDLAVGALPAQKSGTITFGCLNNFCKINNDILDRWAAAMRQVEGSRLLLLARQGGHRQTALDYMRQRGVTGDRVEFTSYSPRREYLKQYHRIDIGLDTFPYNGHTTSLDSFWMGVPVITLVGKTAVSRAGWSQLSNLNLTELAAHTPDQFVQIAVNLANDKPRLAQLRGKLRLKMQQSPLMDAANFAQSIEAAYRKMWLALSHSA